MRMRWRHLLFAHWPIDAEALRPLLPSSLEIDTFDGRAWVGLVPFTMEDVSPVLLPQAPSAMQGAWNGLCGGAIAFHECNVRTYVYPRGRREDPSSRGVWFFSLDASSRLAVWGARTFWGLPYKHARIHLERLGDVIDYGVERIDLGGAGATACPEGQAAPKPAAAQPVAHASRLRAKAWHPVLPGATLRLRWRALDPLPQSQPGDLAQFLTERYCLYATRNSDVLRGRIDHKPWPLRHAELLSLDDSLVRAAGIEVDQSHEPVLYHADELNVRAWRLART